jgi:hypothetical protein
MTREAWDARVAARQEVYGGDFWNQDKLWRAGFDGFRDASAIRYDYLGTGLWADVEISVNGQWIARRIYS